MRVRISDAARADLKEIVDYIARDNPFAARRVRQALRDKIATLSDYPDRGRLIEAENDAELRRVVEGSFLVFYLIRPEFVLVTRIMRGSRDVASELGREPGRSGNE